MDDEQLSWPLYLTVHQDGLSRLNALIEKEEDMAVVDIPTWKLPAGIFTITIYDRNNHAWCERLAFVNYPEQLPAKLLTDRQKYGERQKVTVRLEEDGIALKEGDFSLAVVKSGLDDINRNNFYSDYFLKSELRGYIENPASYFSRRDTVGRNNLFKFTTENLACIIHTE
ncbi:MAG: hypothetical protein LBV32_06390 [Tannerellaceae bacterium]|nr:hypothetical protein [Tannerellaceae bacterium]